MKDFIAEIALFGAIFFFSGTLGAQDIEGVIEQMVEDGALEAEIEDYLQQVSAGRLDINAASREQLEECGLFTPFQIAGLLEYRAEYGALLSLAELQMIDGFSPQFVERISPLVALGSGAVERRLHLEARTRYKFKGGATGLHQYNRVLMEWGGFKAGLLAESDAGEIPLVDHIGGYLGWQKGRWALLAGDYSACFGQGLALWNAFSFTGASQPASVLKRPRGIVPYCSADECRALRGVAASCDIGAGWTASAFASAAGVDAKVTDEGYTSLQTTGYHRTIYEKACKNAMREYLFGANITRRAGLFQAGFTAVAYTYSEPNARKIMPYNVLQMYDGWMWNLAADALLSAGHWRFFAEGALSGSLRPALLAGALLTASYDFEASLLLRHYDIGYIAPHAGAYSTISSVSNQTGVVFSLLWRPLRGLLVSSFSEAVHYPGVRYRIDAPSSAFYEKLKVEYALRRWSVSLQDNYVWQDYAGQGKHSLKGSLKLETDTWKGALRAGATILSSRSSTTAGWALSASAARSLRGGRAILDVSVACYDAPGYDTRVYLFESDLPGNFSLRYYYGKGIATRGLVKLKIGRKWHLSLLAAVADTPECRIQADYKF